MTKNLMYVCACCADNNPEWCGHFNRDELRATKHGWLCKDCFDNTDDLEGEWKDHAAPPEFVPSPAVEGGWREDPRNRLPRHADIIVEALNDYDTFMQDDDYEVWTVLHRIMKRMRERYELAPALPTPPAGEKP